MKSLVCLLAVPIALCAYSCGSADKTSTRSHVASHASTTGHRGHVPYEDTPASMLEFGHAADPADKRAVTAVTMRYYAAAAHEDGATACTLLLSSLARSVPEDYGEGAGPAYLRGGKTCPAVMHKLFVRLHRIFVAEDAGLKVVRVRLKTRGGFVIMRFKTTPELHETNIVHEGSAWKVSSLIDSGIG